MKREQWEARVVKSGDELHVLKQSGELKLYVIYDGASKGDPLGRMPIYTVWDGDKWGYCGPVMASAYNEYDRKLNEASVCSMD